MAPSLLVVKPSSVSTETVLSRVGIPHSANLTVMSNMGASLDLNDRSGKPVHLFAVGDGRFDNVVVAQEFPVLFGNHFTLAWLDRLTRLLNDCGSLMIEYRNPRRNQQFGLVTLELLQSDMPQLAVKQVRNGSLLLIQRKAASECSARFRSIYPALEDYFEEFAAKLEHCNQVFGEDVNERKEAAQRMFIYGLFGANQKSFLMLNILDHFNMRQPVTGLDMGGGYGFFAAEMHYLGHEVIVVDKDPGKTEGLGPWLMARCGLEKQVMFRTVSIEEAGDIEGEEKFDFVSFFGSLLYADRARVPAVLQHVYRLLRRGGLLVIHENPQDISKPGTPDHERKFQSAELFGFMTDFVGEPKCFNAFTGAEISREHAARSLVVAASQKA